MQSDGLLIAMITLREEIIAEEFPAEEKFAEFSQNSQSFVPQFMENVCNSQSFVPQFMENVCNSQFLHKKDANS